MKSGRFVMLAVLGHLYAAVGISYFVGASRLGYWLVSLIVALIVGRYLDTRTSRHVAQ